MGTPPASSRTGVRQRQGERQPSAPRGDTCPHGPRCVPCPLRGLPYGEQLALKAKRVTDALSARARLRRVPVDPPVGSRDLFGYRNVAKLAVRARPDGSLRAGVYAPGTHRLVDAAACRVHHPAINAVLARCLEEAADLGIPAWDERQATGELRFLVARYSRRERRVLLVVVTRSERVPRLGELARRLGRSCRELGGVVQNVNPEPGNVILGRSNRTLRPPGALVERIGRLDLRAGPTSFLQANVWTARRIYEDAVTWAEPAATTHALDLYCGVGALSLFLATRARFVMGIEEVPGAVDDARSNARRNGFSNTRFREGDADDVLADLVGDFDVVTVNPPRRGCRPEVLDALARLGPRRIVYVSCDPVTLARDLDALATRGFRTVRVRPYDMLPQTEHVEILALVERR